MHVLVCNSSERFFYYYVKQINGLIVENRLLVNSHLNLGGKVISNSKKASSLISLIFDLPLLRHFLFVKSEIFVFLSIHPLNIFQYIVLKIRRKKIIQVVHDPVAHPDSKSRLVNIVTHILSQHADRIILHSDYYREHYLSKYGDTEVLPLLGYEMSFRPKKLTKSLLIFGRMEPYKGLNNILDYSALGTFEGWEIIIAGKGHIPEELNHLENITIMNRFITDNELTDLIGRSSFVFLPYDSATQSAVVLHSYSLSTPVICHGVGALGEYVDNTRGFIFEKNNAYQLSSYLKSLNQDNYQELVTNVEEYFYSNFATEKLVGNLLNAFTL